MPSCKDLIPEEFHHAKDARIAPNGAVLVFWAYCEWSCDMPRKISLATSLAEHLENDCTAKNPEDCPFVKEILKENKQDNLDKHGDVDSLENGSSKALEKGVEKLRKFIPGVSVRMVDDSSECLALLDDEVRRSIAESEYKFFHDRMSKYHAMKSPSDRSWKIMNRIPNVIRQCFRMVASESTKKNMEDYIKITTEAINKSTKMKGDGSPFVLDPNGNHNWHLVPTSFFDDLPFHLDRPAAVFRSVSAKSQKSKKDERNGIVKTIEELLKEESYVGSLLALFNVKDARTDTYVVVPVVLSDPSVEKLPDGKRCFIIQTAYGKSHLNRENSSYYRISDDMHPYDAFYKWIEGTRHGDKEGELLYIDNEQIEEMKKNDKRFANSGIMWPRPGDKKFPRLLCPSRFRGHGLGLLVADYYDGNGQLRNDKDDLNKKCRSIVNAYVNGDEETSHKALEDFNRMLDSLAKTRGWKKIEDEEHAGYEKTIGGRKVFVSSNIIEHLDDDYNLKFDYKDFLNDYDYGKRLRIIEKDGEPIGWYNRTNSEVCLVKGKAGLETLYHELGWHATYHWAEKNSPELYRKMRDYAKNAPEAVQELVRERYGDDLEEDVLIDEIGAERFTEEDIDKIKDAVKKDMAIGWFGKVKACIGKTYEALKSAFTRNRIGGKSIGEMTTREAIRMLVDTMVSGKSIESIAKDELNFIVYEYQML